MFQDSLGYFSVVFCFLFDLSPSPLGDEIALILVFLHYKIAGETKEEKGHPGAQEKLENMT